MSCKVVLHVKIDLTFKPVSIFEGNRVRPEVIVILLVHSCLIIGEDWKIRSSLRILPSTHVTPYKPRPWLRLNSNWPTRTEEILLEVSSW